MNRKLNFIFFMPEELRADAVGAVNPTIANTPTMSQIGSEGVIFKNCFSQHTVCAPSRCSMFTGLYPHCNAHRTLNYLLQPNERHLFRELKENGYFVQCFGKNDLLSQDAISSGFDSVELYFQPEECYLDLSVPPWPEGHKYRKSFYYGRREGTNVKDYDWAIIESALQFIKEKRSQPFCLFLPLEFSHPPYTVEEPYFSMYNRMDMPNPIPPDFQDKRSFMRMIHESYGLSRLNELDFREIKATYYGMVTRLDDQLKQICDKLKSTGQYDNTAIFIFSDHGDYAGDYGLTEKWWTAFQDCLIHVPFIAKIPGYEPVGSIDALIEMIDLFPTIMELAEIEPNHFHFGKSLVPLMRGERTQHREVVFAEGGFLLEEKHCFEPFVEEGKIYYEKIRLPHRDPKTYLKAVMVRTDRYKYIYCPDDMDEMYDLKVDPQELLNIADKSNVIGMKQELRDRITKWLLRTTDSVPLKCDSRHWKGKG